MLLRLALLFLAAFCLVFGDAFATDTPDQQQMKLLYSADDKLCAPLADVYDRLNHQHGKGRHFVLNWEDQFSGRFKEIGLNKPTAVDGPKPEGPSMHLEGLTQQKYYKANLSSVDRNRILYLDDECVGRCNEFSTTIWVFKPNAKPSLKQFDGGYSSHTTSNQWKLFDPDVIESDISFSLGSITETKSTAGELAYPTIHGRFFDQIASDQEKSLSLQERLNRYEIYISGGTNSFTQRVWNFEGNAIFTARELNVGVLAYRYNGPNSVEDVCYIANEEAISAQKKFK